MSLQDLSIDVSDLPPGLGRVQHVTLPTTRYRQGGRVQYHVNLQLAQLPQVIVRRPDPDHPLPGNRKVELGRAKKFSEYLRKDEDWVSPAIIVRVPMNEVEFDAKQQFGDGTAWGVLTIPLDVLIELLLLDGQHRTLGVFLALEDQNVQVRSLRQTIKEMEEQAARRRESRSKGDSSTRRTRCAIAS